MKKLIFLFLVCCLMGTNVIAQQWNNWAWGTHLSFLNKQKGFGANEGYLFIIENGWATKTISLPDFYMNFDDMFFLTDSLGWIMGRDNNDNTPCILKTFDGGYNWDKTTLNHQAGVGQIYFTSPNDGWLLDKNLFHTTDGGDTWTDVSVNNKTTFNRMFFLNNNTGWLASDSLYVTHDGGNNWTGISSKSFTRLMFVDENLGFASINTILYKTTNGGVTWMQHSQGNAMGFIQNIFALDEKHIWIADEISWLYGTKDGSNWNMTLNQASGDIYFINPLRGFCGEFTYIVDFKPCTIGYTGINEVTYTWDTINPLPIDSLFVYSIYDNNLIKKLPYKVGTYKGIPNASFKGIDTEGNAITYSSSGFNISIEPLDNNGYYVYRWNDYTVSDIDHYSLYTGTRSDKMKVVKNIYGAEYTIPKGRGMRYYQAEVVVKNSCRPDMGNPRSNFVLYAEPPAMCYITTENNHNRIVWSKEGTWDSSVVFHIYRNDTDIGTVNLSQEPNFIDPVQTSEAVSYSILALLPDGGATHSQHINNIFLTTTNQNEKQKLSWNPYPQTHQYYIYRGTSLHKMQLIDSVDGNTNQYLIPQDRGIWYYQTQAVLLSPCQPNSKNPSSNAVVSTLPPAMCYVSNENNHNRVVWSKQGTWDSSVVFHVYKNDKMIGSVPYTQESVFVDTAMVSGIATYSVIAALPNGDKTAKSESISNIFLTTTQTKDANMLAWNMAPQTHQYYIYRGVSPNNMLLIDSVAADKISYTDANNTAGIWYYRVDCQPLQNQCNVNRYHSNVTKISNPQSICLVTVDDQNHNVLAWEKPTNFAHLDSVFIYRETSQLNQFVKVGTTTISTSMFEDVNSNAAQQSHRYRLSVLDTVGAESVLGDIHKTMHLSINLGVDTTVNLIWEQYMGFEVQSYNIYRGTKADSLTLLASVSGINNSYTDLNPPQQTTYYQVSVLAPHDCATSRTSEKNIGVSKSNKAIKASTGIENLKKQGNGISLYPNPASNQLTVDISAIKPSLFHINIVNILGETLALPDVWVNNHKSVLVDISSLPTGIYVLQLTGNEITNSQIFVKK